MVGGERTTCASTASSLKLRRANARRPLTHSQQCQHGVKAKIEKNEAAGHCCCMTASPAITQLLAKSKCCKSCDLGPELGGEVESPEHFLFDCPVYQAQRQKLWEKLTSDPDVAAKCQILDGKSDEEKLHSMLNEEFWGVDVDEESGLVYGPFKHAFKCIAKYVAAAWKIRNAYAHPSDVA